MADTLAFDELNIFRKGNFDSVSEESKKIYEKLGIQTSAVVEQRIYEMLSQTAMPQDAIERRLRLACKFEDEFIYTLLWLYLTQDGDADSIGNQFYEDYGAAIEGFVSGVSFDRGIDFADFVTETTLKEKDYTEDRAVKMAVTESLVLNDSKDYEDAVSSGKSYKIWNSVMIPTTRDWHRESNGDMVGIDEYFFVKGEPMLYPHDPRASAENLVGCLCWCEYR